MHIVSYLPQLNLQLETQKLTGLSHLLTSFRQQVVLTPPELLAILATNQNVCTWRRPLRSKHCTIAIYCSCLICYVKCSTLLLTFEAIAMSFYHITKVLFILLQYSRMQHDTLHTQTYNRYMYVHHCLSTPLSFFPPSSLCWASFTYSMTMHPAPCCMYTVGYDRVGRMCDEDHSCAIVEHYGLQCGFRIAHNTGHR